VVAKAALAGEVLEALSLVLTVAVTVTTELTGGDEVSGGGVDGIEIITDSIQGSDGRSTTTTVSNIGDPVT